MTSNLTPEELAEAVAKIAELDNDRNNAAENWPLDDYKIGLPPHSITWALASIRMKPAHMNFIAAAPLMARINRQLWAEREQREKQLCKALHPNGVKHPQQGEWAWLIEEATVMQNRLDELEAHHCEAPRNKRIMELEKECAALAAHQCHKPYGDEYGNMRCEYQDKVAKYESDHPWAKALQDVAEEQAATIARHRAVMQQARDALAKIADSAAVYTTGEGHAKCSEIALEHLAALDAVLKGGA